MVSSADRVFFGGFASGLDTNALIDALIQVQTRPILLAEDRRKTIEAQKTEFAKVNGSLINLLGHLNNLRDSSIVGKRRATTDQSFNDPSRLTVKSSSSAAVGTFTVDIVSLATPTSVDSIAAVGQAVGQAVPLDQAGFDAAVVAGTFTIDSTEFTIAEGTGSTAESSAAIGGTVSTISTLDSAGLTVTLDPTGSFTINSIQISYDATVDSLTVMVSRINSSSAGVTASYDAGTKKLKITNNTNGPSLNTFADNTGNFLEAMSFFDGVPTNIAVEVAGTDLISLTDVVSMINVAAIGVTASIVNDSDSRPNLLQLTSAGNIALGSASDTSNFLAVTHMLESPGGTTRTSVRNLGQLGASKTLDSARMLTALSVSTGEFLINGVTIAYDEAADSLANVISRINQSSAGVTATYDVLGDKLSITADSTGSIGIGLSDTTGNFLAAFNVLSGTQTLGANSSYKIDGGALQYSASNSVGNAVTGVTLDFKDTTTSAITVTIAADTTGMRSRITAFVEQYNSTMSIMGTSTKVDDSGDEDGELAGDTTMITLMKNLRTRVVGRAVGMTGDITSLADIGLNFGAVGVSVGETELLLFDSGTFDTAMKDNAEAVELVLAGFSASASLKAGGTGSVIAVSGTPTSAKDSGSYDLTTTAAGMLTMTFRPDDGSGIVVVNKSISPGEVNTMLIPGLAITFDNPLISGSNTITISARQEGVGKSLYEYVQSYTRSNGVMAGRDESLTNQIDVINDSIERMEKRLDAKRAFLIAKFARLEMAMQRLNNQQAALSTLVTQIGRNK